MRSNRCLVLVLAAALPLAAALAVTPPHLARFATASSARRCHSGLRCAPLMSAAAAERPDVVGDNGAHVPLPPWLQKLSEAQEAGLGSAALLAATAVSLTLANTPATSAAWLAMWDTHVGPAIGSHHLTIRGWINEGLMAVFFFIVGVLPGPGRPGMHAGTRCGSPAPHSCNLGFTLNP